MARIGTRGIRRRASEENGEVAVQLVLEVLLDDGTCGLRRRRGGAQPRAQLLEVQTNEPQRAVTIEDGKHDERASRRRGRRDEDLPLLPRVIHLAEWLPLHLATEMIGRCVNRRRERTRTHDVHGARESMLPEYLPVRMQH